MLPKRVIDILEKIEAAGYEAFAVGGCVRDILMGREPSDFDITTSATPRETEEIFTGETLIETGLKHGTVTLVRDGEPFEITTFRTDGEYLDMRHPESVSFTKSIEEDLARRDLTVNSIAMDRNGRLFDPFEGEKDIVQGTVRCTGDPDRRFGEDALRIIRALRFASVLGFKIDCDTSEAIHRRKASLLNISAERIFSELKKLLCGKNVFRILTDYSDVICEIIPELSPSVGFDHKSKYHIYDVFTHIAKTVEAIRPDPTLRLTMLFHDIGKPYVFTEDPDGTRHFKGHPEKSEEIAKEVLRRLRADKKTVNTIALLCRIHDRQLLPEERSVKRLLTKISVEDAKLLCEVRKADASAHAPEFPDRGAEAEQIAAIIEKIEEEARCFGLSSLAVNGRDVAALGYKGRKIGEALEYLLSEVIDERLPNEKENLLSALENRRNAERSKGSDSIGHN